MLSPATTCQMQLNNGTYSWRWGALLSGGVGKPLPPYWNRVTIKNWRVIYFLGYGIITCLTWTHWPFSSLLTKPRSESHGNHQLKGATSAGKKENYHHTYAELYYNKCARLLSTPFSLFLHSELSWCLPHEWPGETKPNGTFWFGSPKLRKQEGNLYGSQRKAGHEEESGCKSLQWPSSVAY